MTRLLAVLGLLTLAGCVPGCQLAAQLGDRRWHHVMPFGGFSGAVATVAVIVAALWLVSNLTSHPGAPPQAPPAPPAPPEAPPGPPAATETPREILNRRYAAGEITREQYLEMRRDIGV